MTVWRGRLELALDALEAAAQIENGTTSTAPRRLAPIETTNVQLPTGDRLQIPTGAETLRLKGYLIVCRGRSSDYAELANLVDGIDTETAATVLQHIDQHYHSGQSRPQWISTQLVRRLADPDPTDFDDDDRWSGPEGAAAWQKIRQRCLAVAVAILEETK